MIAIVDYGMGNLRSVSKAFEHLRHAAKVVQTAPELAHASRLVIPGVGAFPDAIKHLHERGLIEPLRAFVASGRPVLGICLGMQILFAESEEFGRHSGLGLLAGRVVRFSAPGIKVPHIGWNTLAIERDSAVLQGVGPGAAFYFVHSFFVQPAEPEVVVTTTEYGQRFASSVQWNNVFACQYHPEKSQTVGLRLLDNFARWQP